MLVNVTIPVYNEEHILRKSISSLHTFLKDKARFDWEIVVANNASIDGTLKVARALCAELDQVHVVHLDQKGRGRALKRVWQERKCDIYSYMDVDLSTNLFAYPPMIEALICTGFDIGIGSRLLKASSTRRSLKREVVSRAYNLLVKAFFRTRFSDAQCGFKAISASAAQKLLPSVEDTTWFFDTELLVIAEKHGYRIFDLPVSWIEDLDSRVDIVQTALDDIKGLIRVKQNFRRGAYGHL